MTETEWTEAFLAGSTFQMDEVFRNADVVPKTGGLYSPERMGWSRDRASEAAYRSWHRDRAKK